MRARAHSRPGYLPMIFNLLNRRSLFLGLIGAVALSSGCARKVNSPPAALDETPVPVDQAMERRNWEPRSVLYANTATHANNTGFMFAPDPKLPIWLFGLVDTPIFFGNVFTMPYSLIVTPPGVQVEYRSESVPPTSNGNPPWPAPPPPPPSSGDAP